MEIQNKEILEQFIFRHADSRNAINRFITMLEQAAIQNHNELLQLFPHADFVGNSRYVFDIRGNNYRIICLITYRLGIAYVRFVGTHAEYDRVNAAII